MSFAHVDDLAATLLFEGQRLYPYRSSAPKNQHAFPFGVLSPRAYAESVGGSERFRLTMECLVAGAEHAGLRIELRFLRPAVEPSETPREVRVALAPVTLSSLRDEALRHTGEDGQVDYCVVARAERLERALHRLSIEVRNTSQPVLDQATRAGRPEREVRQGMLQHSLAMVHLLVGVLEPTQAQLISLLEPPAHAAMHTESCRNDGVFPVLIGALGRCDTMLASPVILYDYPRLAPESQGDFYDSTEIDVMLSLRMLTLSDGEKAELRRGGGVAAELLARTESLDADAMSALHGRLQQRPPDQATCRRGATIVSGDAVRIHPRGRADAMDLALSEREATVASIEQDIDGTLLIAVTVDDDPGRDLGLRGWPGHRFFFRPSELERIA